MLLGFSRRNVVRPASQKSRRPAFRRRRLYYDCLEDRRLLSGGSLTTPGTSVTVDSSGTASLNFESPRAVAMDRAGDAVVAWADQQSNGNWNLMFQRYTKGFDAATGLYDLMQPVGSTMTAASNVTTGPWEDSASGDGSIMVARAPTSGDFVVVWATGTNATNRNTWGTEATHAQLYSSAGTPIGSAVLLSGSNLPKSVAMNDTGFDVLYAALPKSGPGYTLNVQRYSYTSGSDAALGKPISVATPGSDDYGNGSASMAMDGNGNFVVGWKDWTNNNTTNTQYIDAELFTSAGGGHGVIHVISANKALNQGVDYGDVAMDSAGNFIVDWMYQAPGQSSSLQARQFSTGGIPVQAESNPIIVSSAANWFGGVVETGGGAFDVAWTGPQNELEIATYDPSANPTQSFAVTDAIGPSMAVDGSNDLFIVFNHDGNNVVGQFFLDPPAPAPTASASTASSFSGTDSPSGSTAASIDAVFAVYAYPEDDETLS